MAAPRIVAIGTAVPTARLTQDAVRDMFAAQPGTSRLTQRLIHAAFDAADIETRHSVLSQLASGQAPTRRRRCSGMPPAPCTRRRPASATTSTCGTRPDSTHGRHGPH